MLPKMGKVLLERGGKGDSELVYAAAIATALRNELGNTHRAIKIVMRWAGASERAVKNWLMGTNGPRGEHLISLVRHSNAVLGVFLQLAGREDAILGTTLKDIRERATQLQRCLSMFVGDAPISRGGE